MLTMKPENIKTHTNNFELLVNSMPSRYACYLIVQNGNPNNKEIAFAKNIFANQTNKAALIHKSIVS